MYVCVSPDFFLCISTCFFLYLFLFCPAAVARVSFLALIKIDLLLLNTEFDFLLFAHEYCGTNSYNLDGINHFLCVVRQASVYPSM